MNNREAIKMLKTILRTVYLGNRKFIEAVEKAISALECKDRYDQFWEEVKSAGMMGKETEIHHSGRVFRIREVSQ